MRVSFRTLLPVDPPQLYTLGIESSTKVHTQGLSFPRLHINISCIAPLRFRKESPLISAFHPIHPFPQIMDSVKKQSIEQLEIAPDVNRPFIDPVAEKKLLRKVDLRILPPLTVLFLLAFLDRTNIGNAKIQGMTAELKMGGHDYNIALFVFFIPVSLEGWQ